MKSLRGRFYWTIVAVLLFAGFTLRAITFYCTTGFGADEAAIAHNIGARSFGQFAVPMTLDQAVGGGFLAVVKSFTIAFGNNQHVFRLFSLLGGCAVLILFFIAAWRFANRSQALIGLALLAASPSMVRYSSVLEPYTTDAAMAAALLILFFVVLKTRDARPLIGLGFAGLVAPWLSPPTVFVLAGFGLCCLAAAIAHKDGKWAAVWICLALLWGASFMIEYSHIPRPSLAESPMPHDWSGAFIALPPNSLAQARQLIGGSTDMFANLFGVHLAYLAAALGAVVIARQNPLRSCMLVAPFFLVLVASMFHQYSLSGGFLIFLAPLLAFLIAAGIDTFWTRRRWWIKLVAAAWVVGLLFKPVADDVHSTAAMRPHHFKVNPAAT